MKIPKILILLMSCHDKVFLDEEILCKNTWLKFVDNFDNINYYIYKAGKQDQIIHHDIFVKAPDDKDHTYTKTIRCFELINNRNIEYDYIVRTNLSTFINIPLLNEYLTFKFNNVDDHRINHIESHIKDGVYMISGKFMIFEKPHIDIFLDNKLNVDNGYFDDFLLSKSLQTTISTPLINLELYSYYDLVNYKQIPAIYLNDIKSRINYRDFNDISSYEDINNAIAICCKQVYETDNINQEEKFNKFYELVLNGYKPNDEIVKYICNYCANNFSHNQNLERMFQHYLNMLVVIVNTYQINIEEYEDELSNIDGISKIMQISDSSKFLDIYEKYNKEYRWIIFIDNEIAKFKNNLQNNLSRVWTTDIVKLSDKSFIIRGNLVNAKEQIEKTQMK